MIAARRVFTVLLAAFSCVPRLPAEWSGEDRMLLAKAWTRVTAGGVPSFPSAEASDAEKWFREGSRCAVGRQWEEAVNWFRKAAEQGHVMAQMELGRCYYRGKGVTKNDVEAVRWYRRAAEQDDPLAQFWLGQAYALGEGVAKNNAEAVHWYRKAAEQGLVMAQIELGACYYMGEGVAKNNAEAAKWYRKAAEQDEPHAQFMLGHAYVSGEGVAHDEVEAVRWFRRAAEQDVPPAQYRLGQAYASGKGVARDEVEAVKWYRRAAEQDNHLAQFWLGQAYASGKGVARDEVEAVKWYRRAAEQDNPLAQLRLGRSYALGRGVAKDVLKAAKWYRKAAEQGQGMAQSILSALYAEGDGVPKDFVEAYKWCLLAAAHGYEDDREYLPKLESRMTREQIAEGQKLARNFKPGVGPSAGDDDPDRGKAGTRPVSSGTGFFITGDGYFITNEHVAKGGGRVRLGTSEGLISAKVVKLDAANDLALLKAEGRFPALPVVSSRTVRLGSTVATVGFPNIGMQGFAPKLAKGEIAALSGANDDARHFQISVPLQPGNSGGALVDERGNVVGVVAAKLSTWATLEEIGELPENVNYAVKGSLLLGFLESVPEVAAKLKAPNTEERRFEDVVKAAERAAVMVIVD